LEPDSMLGEEGRIEVVWHDDQKLWYSLDNRRLWCLKKVFAPSTQIKVRDVTGNKKKELSWKYSTVSDGTNIALKPKGYKRLLSDNVHERHIFVRSSPDILRDAYPEGKLRSLGVKMSFEKQFGSHVCILRGMEQHVQMGGKEIYLQFGEGVADSSGAADCPPPEKNNSTDPKGDYSTGRSSSSESGDNSWSSSGWNSGGWNSDDWNSSASNNWGAPGRASHADHAADFRKDYNKGSWKDYYQDYYQPEGGPGLFSKSCAPNTSPGTPGSAKTSSSNTASTKKGASGDATSAGNSYKGGFAGKGSFGSSPNTKASWAARGKNGASADAPSDEQTHKGGSCGSRPNVKSDYNPQTERRTYQVQERLGNTILHQVQERVIFLLARHTVNLVQTPRRGKNVMKFRGQCVLPQEVSGSATRTAREFFWRPTHPTSFGRLSSINHINDIKSEVGSNSAWGSAFNTSGVSNDPDCSVQ
jgi:hypothetical protein